MPISKKRIAFASIPACDFCQNSFQNTIRSLRLLLPIHRRYNIIHIRYYFHVSRSGAGVRLRHLRPFPIRMTKRIVPVKRLGRWGAWRGLLTLSLGARFHRISFRSCHASATATLWNRAQNRPAFSITIPKKEHLVMPPLNFDVVQAAKFLESTILPLRQRLVYVVMSSQWSFGYQFPYRVRSH